MKSKELDPRYFLGVEEKTYSFGRMPTATWQPAIDVCETKSAITVRAEVPGVVAEDLSVRIKGATLILDGIKRRPSFDGKPPCYIRLERAYGEFRQEIAIDWPLDAERATASLQGGILTIELPKLEKVVEVPIVKK